MNKYQVTVLFLGVLMMSVTVVMVAMRSFFHLEVYGGYILACLYFILLVIAFVMRYAVKQNTSSTREANVEDQPPSYESVTTKPPPYHHLFTEAPPTADVTQGTPSTSDCVPVHNVVQGPVRPTGRDETTPPMYSEVVNINRLCKIHPSGTVLASSPHSPHSPCLPAPSPS